MLAILTTQPHSSFNFFNILYYIFAFLVIIPSIAVSVRRLHDTGRSGWWWFIQFVPLVGSFVLLYFLCLDSQPGENKWGANPKTGAGAVAPVEAW